jgi:hypothetical protein
VAVNELEEFLCLTPLEMLAWAFLRFETLASAAVDVFSSYNDFLALLDGDARNELSALSHEDAVGNETFQNARQLGQKFQGGLNSLFLGDSRQGFSELTRKYGVF